MIVLLILDHINEGGSFAFLAKIMDWYNSIGRPQLSIAQKTEECVYIEYKAGKRKYGLLFPIRLRPLDWKVVVAEDKDGATSVVTDEFLYFAGPYKDFCGIPLKPKHINTEYVKIGFMYAENDILEVQADEIIIAKFKERAEKLKKK
jgi:hypothetical protein